MDKKVLFIAYFFPPLGGSGVQRTLKYVKYIGEFGIEPIIATVKSGHNYAYDYEMLEEVPKDVKIYRSNSGEKLYLRKVIETVDKVLKKYRSNDCEICEEKSIAVVSDKESSIPREGIKTKIFRYLEYNHYVPDTKIRWYKHAVKDIKNRILKENDIDIIYSTSYPYTDHLIGLEIKKYTNKPWIVDLRDPWVGNKFIYERYGEKRKNKEREMEEEVIKNADLVINVTESISDEYKKRYPQYADKFTVITNGFDRDDLKNITKVNEDKFTIRYTGILSEGLSIDSFIRAVEELLEEDKELEKDISIEFTGFMPSEHNNIILKSNIKDKVTIRGYVSHGEALNLMASANINMIILPDEENSKGIYTGKIFDCILIEKPILAIMPVDGIAAKLINDNNIGKAVEHDDIEQIKIFIKSEYDNYKMGINRNTGAVEKCKQFDRKNLAKSLAGYFNKILGSEEY